MCPSAEKLDLPFQPRKPNLILKHLKQRTVADDPALKRGASLQEQAARVNQVAMPFLFNQPANGQDAEFRAGRNARRRAKSRQIHPRVQHQQLVFRETPILLQKVLAVELRDSHREARAADLLGDQNGTDKDVLRMGCQTVRNA